MSVYILKEYCLCPDCYDKVLTVLWKKYLWFILVLKAVRHSRLVGPSSHSVFVKSNSQGSQPCTLARRMGTANSVCFIS